MVLNTVEGDLATVLVIEDDRQLAAWLVTALQQAGLEALQTTGAKGLGMVYQAQPSLVIATDEIPYTRIRQVSGVPIIVLGNTRGTIAMANALYLGADAYMTKPPGLAELMSRVRSLLRRYRPMERFPEMDLMTRDVKLGDRVIKLAPTEFRLFSCLVLNAGRVVPYEQLVQEVWGGNIKRNTIYMHVWRLKKKLGMDSPGPWSFLAFRGRGYSFVADEAGTGWTGGSAETAVSSHTGSYATTAAAAQQEDRL